MSSKEQVFSLREFLVTRLLSWSVPLVNCLDTFDDVELPKISAVFFWKLYGVSFCVEVQDTLYINFVHGVERGQFRFYPLRQSMFWQRFLNRLS